MEPGTATHYAAADPAAVESDRELIALYAESFPAAEREPFPIILKTLAANRGVLVRAQVDARTIGFAMVHWVRQPALGFLVYLAVNPRLRSRGIGAALFEAGWSETVNATGAGSSPAGRYVWEIDRPALAGDPGEKSHRLRRLEFFQRQGGEVIFENYFQPAINGPTPVPMLLMERRTPGATAVDVTSIVRGIYFEKYGWANGIDHGALEQLLASARVGGC